MSGRGAHWLLAVASCVAMIALHAGAGEFPTTNVRRVELGQPGRLYGSTVTVQSSAIGQVLYEGEVFQGRSAVVFLAVRVDVATDGERQGTLWTVGGRAGGRTFAPRGMVFVPDPGFRIVQDVVFELDPGDLAGFTVTFLDRAPIYAHDPQLEVDLGITPDGARELVERDRYAAVRAITGDNPEPIR